MRRLLYLLTRRSPDFVFALYLYQRLKGKRRYVSINSILNNVQYANFGKQVLSNIDIFSYHSSYCEYFSIKIVSIDKVKCARKYI